MTFIALVITGLFTLAGILVSLHRFWQYEIFYYDFGIFASAIWNASRLRAPIIDHLVVGGRWIFADHLNPSIFLLTPIYWLTDRIEGLLVAQAVIVGMSAWVIYRSSVRILGRGLPALTVLVSYTLFAGLQNALLSDFHEVTVMTLPLALVFWAIVTGKKWWYWGSFVIMLGGKESMFVVGLGIAAFIWVYKKEWRSQAIISIVVSLLWGLVATRVVIPYFSGGRFQYAPTFRSSLGANIIAFVDEPVKRRTLVYSIASFGFLPVIALPVWPLIFFDFLVRFVPENTNTRWDLGLHYNALLAVILAFGMTIGFRYYKQKLRHSGAVNLLALLIMFLSFGIWWKELKRPFALAFNRAFYAHTRDFVFLDDLVAHVPKDGTVMAQNNLAVRFIPQGVWLLRPDYQSFGPDYIVIDLRDGQNPNNFFGTGKPELILNALATDPTYEQLYAQGAQYIFRKID